MKLVPDWVYLVVIGVLIVLVGTQQARVYGLKSDIATIRQQHADERSRLEQMRADAERLARETERQLSNDAAKLAKEKQDEIDRISGDLDAAVKRLREREKRQPAAAAGAVAAPAAACKGTDGSGLYAEDAEFLIREAARADQLRAALDQCYRQYDAGREINP